MGTFRLLGATLVALLVVGCKLEVNVPAEGGTVTTASGNYSCGAGRACVIDVNDTSFDERFQALPAEGYYFAGWKRAKNHFCGNKNSSCNLATESFAGNALLMSFLTGSNADKTFYLEPVFEPQQSGGAFWLWQKVSCNSFSGRIDLTDEGPNAEEFGVLDGEYSTEGQDCSDYDTYYYEESPTTGERRVAEIRPPISESAQCPDDPGCGRSRETTRLNYVELIRQGVAVERLKRIDTNISQLGIADDNPGIDESIVLGYEQNIGTQGRLNSYEEWTLDNDENGEQSVVTVEYSASWNYEDDGTVTEVTTSTFDEDFGEIPGRIRYVLEGGGLVAYTEADLLGDTYTLGKKVFPDRGLADGLTLTTPPTGQVETENAWVLPENYTEYELDFDNDVLVPTEKLEIVRTSRRGYILETLESFYDAEADEWVPGIRSLYGYGTDPEGTVYRKVELTFVWDTDRGRWEPSTAFINRFRQDPLIFTP